MLLEIIKWVATATLITGSYINASGYPAGPFILIAGGILWLTASFIMKDKPLIATNLMMTLAGSVGLYQQYIG
jgi:hypothetical protein